MTGKLLVIKINSYYFPKPYQNLNFLHFSTHKTSIQQFSTSFNLCQKLQNHQNRHICILSHSKFCRKRDIFIPFSSNKFIIFRATHSTMNYGDFPYLFMRLAFNSFSTHFRFHDLWQVQQRGRIKKNGSKMEQL